MASSSKGRASSRKQSGAGKARVISTKRKDALPRTGNVSAGRRKPVVLPPIDALTEPLATAVAAPKKKSHNLHQKEPTASRKKTTRAAGRASAKPDEPAAMEVAPAVVDTVEVAPPAPIPVIEPAMVTAPEPVVDTVVAVEPPAPAYEEFAVTALEEPEVEALPVFETVSEFEVEASAIVEELPVEAVTAPRIAIAPPPIPEATRATPLPAPYQERRFPMLSISWLLSALSRWTGVSGPK
jgi:hypothetical protein